MFDDLRKDSGSGDFADNEIERLFEPKETKPKMRPSGRFLGMTAAQRFVLSFLLLAVICLGGILALVALERIVIF